MIEPLTHKQEQWVRFGIWALTIAVYAIALDSPFQFDDATAILRDPAAQSVATAVDHFGVGLRPVLDLSYALCWALGGGAPWPFHVANLLLHLMNIEFVMRLTSAALDRSSEWPFRGVTKASATSGALFALHPIQTEAVTYVSGRSSLLSTSFVLAVLLFFVAYLRGRQQRFYVAAVVTFVLAVLTKEMSVTVPMALLLWEVCFDRSSLRTLARRFAPWMICGLIALVGLVMHPRYFSLLMQIVGKRPVGEAAIAQVNGVAYLAAKLTLFDAPCIDPGLGFNPNVGWISWVAFVIVLGGLVVVAWLYQELRSVVGFGLGFFLLQVFVPYVVLPRADVINERHAYAGTFGIFLPIGVLVQCHALHRVHRAQWGIVGFVCAILVFSTVKRNAQYGSELALWQATTRCAPRNPRAFNNLGVAHEKAGQLLLAKAAYAKAIALEPRYANARVNFVRATNERAAEPSDLGRRPDAGL